MNSFSDNESGQGSRMHLFVTGSNGQVAQALMALGHHDVRVSSLGRPEMDITDIASIERAVQRVRPDIIVNAAAYTAVDKAESEPELAFAINRDGAQNVACVAAEADLPVIHISTDYVFSGDKDGAYLESDPTGPTGVYGASKLAGEEAVAEANPRHVILRTAWVYSPYGHNFLKTMLQLAETRDVIRVVADQRGTPTRAADIAAGIAVVARQLLDKHSSADELAGIYHMVGTGETTWAGFAEEIFASSKALGGPFAEVEPITTADYPTPARRPSNSRLAATKFTETFQHALPEWQTATRDCVRALVG